MATLLERIDTREFIETKEVKLFKDKPLGIGSYGAVYKAKVDDLICAAKVIHLTLYDPEAHKRVGPNLQHRLPFQRFQQECEFMKTIVHPNIVQYLGIAEDLDSDQRLPVLLMELMDISLTSFLESSQTPIPYHIQVNFGHDVSMALSYLHLRGIIHRDLSSNNVLLVGNVRAKVTDFGMARLELNRMNSQERHASSFTKCPGTQVYMPPESLKEKPTYSEKIDSFSFGAIIIQILTREFPDPDEQMKELTPDSDTFVRVAEVKRRKKHIDLVDPGHPLLPISLECLNDKEDKRPSSRELCQRLEALKESPKYAESVQEENLNPVMNGSSDQHGAAAIGKSENNSMNGHATENIESVLQEKEKALQAAREQLKANKQLLSQFQERITELEQQLSNRGKPPTPPITSTKQTTRAQKSPKIQRARNYSPEMSKRNQKTSKMNVQLKWRQAPTAPVPMIRGSSTVCGKIVYFHPKDSRKVYSYDSNLGMWDELPNCPYKDASLVTVCNSLTAVGGRDEKSDEHTDKVFTYDESAGSWIENFPHMPTKRRKAITVCAGTALIVAGGLPHGGAVPIKTVEVLNTETKLWSTATNLTEPVHSGSATISKDHIYILGHYPTTTSVLTCPLKTLLQTCYPKFQSTLPKPDNEAVWSRVADLPFCYSTCVTVYNRVVSICKHQVLAYSQSRNTWDVISHMAIERESCLAAVLPNNDIMIVGGTEGPYSGKDTVEFATLMMM